MDFSPSKPKNCQTESLPPKRGQIKKKIISKIFKSAVTVVSMAGRSGHKVREEARNLSSNSSNYSYEYPSGYSSDNHSG